jgi:hypothetical protein
MPIIAAIAGAVHHERLLTAADVYIVYYDTIYSVQVLQDRQHPNSGIQRCLINYKPSLTVGVGLNVATVFKHAVWRLAEQ